jgi:F0F1-type ATP synthase delta subunit
MSQFNIHFFKEKSRKIDLELLIEFFEKIEGFNIEMDEKSVRFKYKHPRLGYESMFIITPKSQVPDIYRLSPKFLDLNFHLELPILMPDYMAKHHFEFVKNICDKFDFHIYNEMLEDVKPFKMELVLKIFDMVKEAYINKNPVLLVDYHILSKEKLNAILRYLDELYELQKYYKDLETYVPRYHFLTTEKKELVVGIEWKEHTLTLFPPFLDYVFYRNNHEIRVLKYSEIYQSIEKHLHDVPGFIKSTKVIPKKSQSKVFKLMKKTKFTKIEHTFAKENLKKLID